MTVRLGTTLQLLTCMLLYSNGHGMVDPIHPLDRVSLATIVLCNMALKSNTGLQDSSRLQTIPGSTPRTTPSVKINDTNDADFCELRRRLAAAATLSRLYRSSASRGSKSGATRNYCRPIHQKNCRVAQPSAVTPHQ